VSSVLTVNLQLDNNNNNLICIGNDLPRHRHNRFAYGMDNGRAVGEPTSAGQSSRRARRGCRAQQKRKGGRHREAPVSSSGGERVSENASARASLVMGPPLHGGLALGKRDVRSGGHDSHGEHVVHYPRPGDLGTSTSVPSGEVPPV